eukprot:scaffold166795_cov36-Attheya_sp.AAC.1
MEEEEDNGQWTMRRYATVTTRTRTRGKRSDRVTIRAPSFGFGAAAARGGFVSFGHDNQP